MGKARLHGNTLLLATALIWGAGFVAQKIGTVQLGAFTLTAARFFISGVALLPAVLISVRRGRRGTQDATMRLSRSGRGTLLLGGVLCGLCLMLAMVAQQTGLESTSAGKAGFITALYILFVPVFRFFGGRRAPLAVWLSVLAALAGLYLLCVKEGFSISAGDLYVLLCALIFTAHILVVDRFAPLVNGVAMSCAQFFVAALTAAVPALWFEKPGLADVAACWAPLLYLGVVSGGIGYTLQILGQKHTDPAVASLILSLESVFAALSGAVLLGESFTGRELAGCALVFMATIASQLDFGRIFARRRLHAESQKRDAGAL